MASGQRAFANKINKRGAAEVRKQVSSAYLGDLSKSNSGVNISTTALQNVPLCDTVEPPDFEEFLFLYQYAIERDSLRHLLEFPLDDIQAEILRRKVRTISPVIPERGFESDRHIQDCVRCYTKDYLVINRRYKSCPDQNNFKDDRQKQQNVIGQEYEMHHKGSIVTDPFDKKSSLSLSSSSGELPIGSWANSILDLKNSQADPLLPNLLESRPQDEIDAINRSQRQLNRHDALFALYLQQPEEEQIEHRQMALPPTEHFGHRLLVKCLQLKLDLEIEPIFASMALYNIAERKKISENFYFDLNPESLHKMLDGHVPYLDVSSLSRTCIFDITHPSPDTFLVIKLEKILQQGDLSEVAEPYMKDEKNRERARANAAYFCERLGKYRMPFAWTAIYLMNILTSANSLEADKESFRSDSLERKPPGVQSPSESIRKSSLDRPKSSGTPEKWEGYHMDDLGMAFGSFRPVTLTVSSFFKQESDKLSDDDLFKFLVELKKPTYVLKKLKSLPGSLKLDISPCPPENKYCLTPELYKIDPFPDDKARPIKEIAEFPTRDIYEPYTTYRNLLYIYPKLLNFASRQGSARNIAVKVNFMQDEDDSHALQVIFGKSNCPEFSKEAYTAVTYHNKSPSFYDEIKARLPAKLTDGNHLLFTFYHISCQRKIEMTPIETVIGYTWLPLLRDGRLVTGEFNLPVSIEKPPSHYSMLHPDVQLPGMKWVDNHKGLFTIVVDAVSSIHTLDEHLDRFLGLVHAVEENRVPPRIGDSNFEVELKRSIGDLTQARNGPLVRFCPLVLDKLLQLMVRPPVLNGQVVNIGQMVFETLAQIVKRLQNIPELKCDKHGRNGLLTSYIEYLCTLPHPDSSLSSSSPPGPTGPGNYATLGRPISLPVAKQPRHLSSSDPDLPSSNPGSPDNEVANLLGSRKAEQLGSPNRHESHPRYPKLYGKKLVHEELALQWVVSSGSTRDHALSNAWFFFELIVKSMEHHLIKMEKLLTPRKLRFASQFVEDIVALVNMITKDIVDRYSSVQDQTMIKGLNSSLAFFISGCLSLMDRGFIFKLIKLYCKSVSFHVTGNSASDVGGLLVLKLDFIRIVCSHEHYVTLNLPFSVPVTPSGPPSPTSSIASSTSQTSFTSTNTLIDRGVFTELTNEYRFQHFLAGLALSDLATMLDTHLPILHNKAINVVCNLLSSHDADPRFQNSDARARIASLYLPLIGIVIDVLPQLYDPNLDAKTRSTHVNDLAVIDRTVAMAISGSSIYSMSGDSSMSKKCSLSQDATQDLLMCFLWVLKNVEQRIFRAWWSELSLSRLNQLLEVIYYCFSNFEYKGKKVMRQYSLQTAKKSTDMKTKIGDYILGTGSARSEMMMRHKQSEPNLASASSDVALRLRWRKDQTQWKQPFDQMDSRQDGNDCFADGLLSAEISMVAMETMELVIQIVQSSDSLQTLLSFILRVLLHCLALNQSSLVLQNMFATQRSLVTKFPELLFEEDTEQCADLCLRLLRHCSSPLTNIRTHASASLYMLMRQNFEIGNNFARVKMQVTMSLSSLVGQNQTFNEEYLRKSLKTILIYAEVDADLRDTTFPEQVRDLVFNLHMILSDTIKMKEFQEDPEMLLDLMYRIAKGYQNSPDLRLTWLHNMAAKHNERNNYTEAAQCLVHAAGLVAEYLNMLEDKPHLPIGCVSLQLISRNVLEESAVSEDVVSPDEEGICTGKYFSESGLVGLLEQAASSFNMAGMYEAVNSVYRVLIPVYEHNRDFKKLASIHGKLQDAFQNIGKQEGKRVFGTYFRVGFYGSRFGDLDGQEFIYKEPAITKLPEISHRLESFYTAKFGPGVVDIIKDSNTVERNLQNPGKAYIQMTYVEPYFDLYEFRDRVTFFEKNYNIKRFMYATPFTMDGRAHGELREQYKRKTVLTTRQAFPYVKTRLSVVSREQLILSPIEVAIEDIQKKTKELGLALYQEPPDPKMLQMVLQGCIGTTVNQGPVEVALVFLAPLIEGETPSKHHNKLRSCFKDFLKKCDDSLHKNKTLIGIDQREYQRELERNHQQIKEQLSPFISSSIHTSTIKRKHKRDRKAQTLDYSTA